jgi:hypothetical protein
MGYDKSELIRKYETLIEPLEGHSRCRVKDCGAENWGRPLNPFVIEYWNEHLLSRHPKLLAENENELGSALRQLIEVIRFESRRSAAETAAKQASQPAQGGMKIIWTG